MLKLLLTFFLLIQTTDVGITSPQTGETLRGQIQILGSIDYPTFASAELSFAFASDLADNWFSIQTFSQPITNPVLAVWDTTSITDGDYKLRLRITLQDGTLMDSIVTDLKIRNDELPTATPTETPLPKFDRDTPTPRIIEPTQIVLSYPSATPLPVNPASITTDSIYKVFAQSALVVLVLFILFSLLIRLRKN
ncbi:MAG: putative penicillin-binding protein [Chloroflexi bacterium OLB14]|nr:MAG: putative penicillin-binding protein [Chloroflexi bacterium OLB14]